MKQHRASEASKPTAQGRTTTGKAGTAGTEAGDGKRRLTESERRVVQAEIEREIRQIRKQATADFQRGRRKIRIACMALDFVTDEQRRRLAACPLPTKAEVIAELEELQQFLAVE